MAMKKPAHPGLLIRNELEELGLSVAEAAEALGVTRQQLYRVIKGESGVSPEMAVRLEKGLGSTADTWLRMQSLYELSQVRSEGKAKHVKRLVPRLA